MRDWLKNSRKNSGLSQKEVAGYLGITQHYYCLIENDERQKDIDLSIVIKLSKLFGVTTDWIIDQESRKTA